MPVKKDRSDMIKKMIVIIGVLFIVAMLVTVFIELMKPAAAAELQKISSALTDTLNNGNMSFYGVM